MTMVQRAGAQVETVYLPNRPDIMDYTPAALTLDKWCHRAAISTVRLSSEHPLHTYVYAPKQSLAQ